MFCGFNQFDILVALKPQFGLQTSDHVDMDMENKEHWKWSDAEKPKTFVLECWNSSGTFQLKKLEFWDASQANFPSMTHCHPPVVPLLILRKTFVYRVKTLRLTLWGHEGVK